MSPAQQIDEKIAALGDWRGAMLARVRRLIKEADPDAVEDPIQSIRHAVTLDR